jgi:hypothetical protein
MRGISQSQSGDEPLRLAELIVGKPPGLNSHFSCRSFLVLTGIQCELATLLVASD